MESHHNVVQKQVSTRDYNYRQATEDMNTQVDATRGDATTYGEAYHWADNYLTREVPMTAGAGVRGVLCPHPS
jgi:type VI secretion system secreted protein VgrG